MHEARSEENMRLLTIMCVVIIVCACVSTADARPRSSCDSGVCATGYDSPAVAGTVAAVVKAPVRVAVKAAVLPVRAVKAVVERVRDRKPVRRVLGRVLCRRCG